MSSSPFLIKILDATGTVIGDSPITTATALNDTVTLDAVGSLSFTIPATEPRYSLINEGSLFDIYDEVDGYLGRYIFKNDNLSETKERGTVTINCYDILRQLSQINTGFRRQFLLSPVEDVISNLVSLAPGWTGSIQTGIGNTSVTFEGESLLRAIDILRDRWGVHYRFAAAQTLEFGTFGTASGVLICNLEGQIQPVINSRAYVALIDTIGRSRDGDWITNSVIPLGAGQGANQLTIAGATAGTYPILTRYNGDGTQYSYIADSASIAQYGERIHTLSLPQITPLSNNPTDILRARNALKLTAEAYLKRHIAPNPVYTVTVRGLRQKVKVGDLVHLKYQGTDRSSVYMNVDGDFYVTEIRRSRTAKGDRTAVLTIATTAERRTSDQDVMVDVINDVKALKVYFQPSAFRDSKTYLDSIANSAGGLAAYIGAFPGKKPAVFSVTIDKTVTTLTQALIRFKSFPAFTSTDLNVTTAVGTATSYFWNTTLSLYFPKRIHLYIDLVDVSAQFGGPWNSNDQDVQVDQTLDITSIIQNAAGGLYQEHSIIFVCYGDLVTTVADGRVNTSHPSQNVDTSFGTIELTVTILGSATGIISA